MSCTSRVLVDHSERHSFTFEFGPIYFSSSTKPNYLFMNENIWAYNNVVNKKWSDDGCLNDISIQVFITST